MMITTTTIKHNDSNTNYNKHNNNSILAEARGPPGARGDPFRQRLNGYLDGLSNGVLTGI